MEIKHKKAYRTVAVLLLLAFAVTLSFCAVSKKESYHVDEIFTYGLSNSSYLPFWNTKTDTSYMREYVDYLTDGSVLNTPKKIITEAKNGFPVLREKQAEFYSKTTPEWKTATELKDYLVVTEDERFDYLNIIYNQYADVHPPLYYYFIHTISSFFPNTFSNYIGFSVNLLFYIAIILVMLKGLKRHFGFKTAYIITFFYCLSIGAISMTVFFRMYTILTFFALLCTLVHLELKRKDWEFSKKLTASLIAVTVLGFYTQYYYIIFAVFSGIVAVLLMLKDKKFKAIWKYFLRMFISGVISLIIWPFSILHIFFGYRGINAFDNAQNSDKFSAISDYWDIIKDAFFADFNVLGVLFVIFVIVAVGLLFAKKDKNIEKFLIIAVPTFLYTATVAVISDFHDLRYIMCALPGFAFLFVYSLVVIFKNIPRINKDKLMYPVIFVLVGVITIFSLAINRPKTLYAQDNMTNQVLSENDDLNCVYIYNYMFERVPDAVDFIEHDGEILFLMGDEQQQMYDDEKIKSSNSLLLYVSEYSDQSAVLSDIIENTHFTQYELLTQKRNLSQAYIYRLK